MKRKSLALVIVSLGLGLFMAMLDGTIVNISIPSMMKDFGVGVSSISWVLDAYLLVLAVLALTVGRLADQLGRKLVYIIGVSIFTVASLFCAFAWDVNWLIAFRAIQAIGAAIMIAVSMAIMTASFPAEKRGTAMGIWGAVGITAAAVGPTLGGVIVEYLNWHWVFYLNVPIGVLAVILAMVIVPEYKDPVRQRLDLPGMIAFSICIFSLVLAIIKGEDWGWGSAVIIILFVVAAAFLAVFILLERRQSQPMLNMEVFRNITFSSSVICQAGVGFGMIGALFLLTLFLQNILGYSALKAAVGITPIPVAALVFAPVSGRLCDRVGARIPTIVGLVVMGLGIWLLSQLKVDSGWGAVAWRAAITGAGIGLSNPALAVAAMGAGIGGKEGVSSGVLNTSRFVGMTIGVAVFTALLTRSINTQLVKARSDLQTIVTENQQIPSQVKVIVLQQVEHLGEGESTPTTPDLAAIAKAKGIPQDLLLQLQQLSQQITSTIRGYMTDAFTYVFTWAAGIALISLIPALFIRRPREKALDESMFH